MTQSILLKRSKLYALLFIFFRMSHLLYHGVWISFGLEIYIFLSELKPNLHVIQAWNISSMEHF